MKKRKAAVLAAAAFAMTAAFFLNGIRRAEAEVDTDDLSNFQL